MPGFYQALFTVSFVGLSWYGMLAVHELGHVLGAVLTGATVERVVLHPLTISRTDVSPNPYPAVVVWLGPVVGCLFPLAAWWTVPHSWTLLRNTGCFFAGFCLIANGLYLAVGSVQGVGDCHEMLRTGTSEWLLIAFGAVTVPAGLWLWHRLGSVQHFLRSPEIVSPPVAYLCLVLLLAVVIAALAADRVAAELQGHRPAGFHRDGAGASRVFDCRLELRPAWTTSATSSGNAAEPSVGQFSVFQDHSAQICVCPVIRSGSQVVPEFLRLR